jgi:uncharacterized membrane protein
MGKKEHADWLGSKPQQDADLVKDNIDKLLAHEEQARQSRSTSDRVADFIAKLAGSMAFVYGNIAFFAIWIIANTGLVGGKPFDPFPFGMLTMIVSLEAIFLSIFVLVAQNRMQSLSDRRSELGVQVSLLTEYEVTRILILVDRMAAKMGIEESGAPELEMLERDVDPTEVIEQIEAKRNESC